MSTNNNKSPNPSDEPDKKEEQTKPDKMVHYKMYLNIRIAISTKGYEGLTPEERTYWNSVF
jgi:hypothetical protein